LWLYAPPQGYTPAAAPEPGVNSDSPFFRGSFSENVKTVQRKVEENGIRFYALGVGNDPEMMASFQQVARSVRAGEFRALTSADAFIAQLEHELRAQMKEHTSSAQIVDSAIQKPTGSALSSTEIEALSARNIPPEKLTELAQNRIQTGWFDVNDAADRVSVCVYLRRQDLEATLMELRDGTKEGVSGEELKVLISILEPHVGKESLQNVKNINDLVKLVSDLPLPPEVVKQIVGRYDDADVTRVLRTKMNNIMILLLQKQLFNNYEEGWIPLEYLPGSLSREN
jgi:hypothetical protein